MKLNAGIKRVIIAFIIIFTFVLSYKLLLLDSNDARANGNENSNSWAVKINNPKLSNFHKVSEDLYRGAQPDNEGMKELKKLGIKTIVNLRELHSDRDELDGLDLKYIHIKSTAAHIKQHEINEFLDVMKDRNNLPVFVHCQHGSDRTGTMCAFYRMVYQNWSKEDAINEMTQGGFGFHKIWNKFIIPVIEKADINDLRKQYAAEIVK